MTSADGPVVGDHVAPTSVGWDVVGKYVGFAVGGAIGTDDAGLAVGCNDGDPVGRDVAGAAVGAADGNADGAIIGGAVGADDAEVWLGAVVVGVKLGVGGGMVGTGCVGGMVLIRQSSHPVFRRSFTGVRKIRQLPPSWI